MAPRKGKIQGKQNSIKIKSKVNKQRRGKQKGKDAEKPLDNAKWLNNVPGDTLVKQCDTIPNWLDSCVYKQQAPPSSYTDNSTEYANYQNDERIDKSASFSEFSYECTCNNSKYQMKDNESAFEQTPSKTMLSKYIKTGMNQVASFIVESAIRFGKEHGVVVPDKTTPNVYEIATPDFKMNSKYRKIRFKIPEESLAYEDAKKLMWRSLIKKESENCRQKSHIDENKYESGACSSVESMTESLEDILPLLEKLKHSSEIVSGELDLDKLAKEAENNDRLRKRERSRDRIRKFGKRYKSLGAINDKVQGKRFTINKSNWKKFRRDSLELGRQRLTASKKKDEASQSATPSSSPCPYSY